jgi:hypothetical protein
MHATKGVLLPTGVLIVPKLPQQNKTSMAKCSMNNVHRATDSCLAWDNRCRMAFAWLFFSWRSTDKRTHMHPRTHPYMHTHTRTHTLTQAILVWKKECKVVKRLQCQKDHCLFVPICFNTFWLGVDDTSKLNVFTACCKWCVFHFWINKKVVLCVGEAFFIKGTIRDWKNING